MGFESDVVFVQRDWWNASCSANIWMRPLRNDWGGALDRGHWGQRWLELKGGARAKTWSLGGGGPVGSTGWVRAVYQRQTGTDTWEVHWEPSTRGQGTRNKDPNWSNVGMEDSSSEVHARCSPSWQTRGMRETARESWQLGGKEPVTFRQVERSTRPWEWRPPKGIWAQSECGVTRMEGGG